MLAGDKLAGELETSRYFGIRKYLDHNVSLNHLLFRSLIRHQPVKEGVLNSWWRLLGVKTTGERSTESATMILGV